jgi:hypothetical protein
MTKKENALAVVEIEKTVSPIIEKAEWLTIDSEHTMEIGAELLSTLNIQLDKITAERERVTKPLNEALKAERSRWKPIETILDEAVAIIRKKMTVYQTAQKAEADAEEARIAARVKPGTGNLSVATATLKMEEIERPAANVTAQSGAIKFVSVRVFEVMDLSLVPLDYHLANEVAIRKAMIAGIELPGVKYETIQRPSNYR